MKSPYLYAAVVLVLVLGVSVSATSGCSSTRTNTLPAAERAGEPESDAGAEKVLETPISFELAGRPFPVPLVDVETAGRTTRLIVDSGSTHHVFTRAFVADVGWKTRETGSKGTGHAGESMRVTRLEPVDLNIDGFEGSYKQTLTTKGPTAFRKLGISGFLAPQRLLKRGYVHLNFLDRTMIAYQGRAEAARAKIVDSDEQWVQFGSADDDGRFRVDVALGGRDPVPARLDTGGSHTEFEVAYVAAGGATTSARNTTKSEECAGGVSASGACIEAGKRPGSRVRFAGKTVEPVEARIREKVSDGRGGLRALIGMDVLRKCELAVPQNGDAPLLARCQGS